MTGKGLKTDLVKHAFSRGLSFGVREQDNKLKRSEEKLQSTKEAGGRNRLLQNVKS